MKGLSCDSCRTESSTFKDGDMLVNRDEVLFRCCMIILPNNEKIYISNPSHNHYSLSLSLTHTQFGKWNSNCIHNLT